MRALRGLSFGPRIDGASMHRAGVTSCSTPLIPRGCSSTGRVASRGQAPLRIQRRGPHKVSRLASWVVLPGPAPSSARAPTSTLEQDPSYESDGPMSRQMEAAPTWSPELAVGFLRDALRGQIGPAPMWMNREGAGPERSPGPIWRPWSAVEGLEAPNWGRVG